MEENKSPELIQMNSGWIDEELYQKILKLMPITTVDILAMYRGRLLLMLRNNEPGKNLWFVPGGRVRHGETLEKAVSRKLAEETGLTAGKIEKKGTMSHFWPEAHYVSTFFRVDVTDDKVKMNDEHRDYKWISKTTNDLHQYIKQMIEESNIFK